MLIFKYLLQWHAPDFWKCEGSVTTPVSGNADSFLWYDKTKCCWLERRYTGDCGITPNLRYPKNPQCVLVYIRVHVCVCGLGISLYTCGDFFFSRGDILSLWGHFSGPRSEGVYFEFLRFGLWWLGLVNYLYVKSSQRMKNQTLCVCWRWLQFCDIISVTSLPTGSAVQGSLVKQEPTCFVRLILFICVAIWESPCLYICTSR